MMRYTNPRTFLLLLIYLFIIHKYNTYFTLLVCVLSYICCNSIYLSICVSDDSYLADSDTDQRECLGDGRLSSGRCLTLSNPVP